MSTNTKCGPRQCFVFGGKIAQILFDDPDVDRDLLQGVINDQEHHFWSEFFGLYKQHCVRTEDSAAITPEMSPMAPKWRRDENGYIYFSVISNGYSRREWDKYGRHKHWWTPHHDHYSRHVLYRASGKQTINLVYRVVVCPAQKIIRETDLKVEKIRRFAQSKGWKTPHWEVGCLIVDAFKKYQEIEKMGFSSIVLMHKPAVYLKDQSIGFPPQKDRWSFAVTHSSITTGCALDASLVSPDDTFNNTTSFAYLEVGPTPVPCES